MLTKASSELTLFDKLSRLSFNSAAKLLGREGNRLITAGGKYDVDMFVGGIHILVPSHDQLGPLSYSDWSVLELIADALRRGRL